MLLPPANERLISLPGTYVAWANRDCLRQRLGRSASDDEIDRLLLDEFSFISRSQLLSIEANHPFDVGEGERDVFRPADYGRAALFGTVFGPMDAKGIGIAPGHAPILSPYGTGLLDLPEAVIEACVQRLLAKTLSAHRPTTVETLAILVPPIRTRNPLTGGGSLQCAFLIRDAYPRILPSRDMILLNEISRIALLIENKIRKRGLTSAAPANAVKVQAAGGALKVLDSNDSVRFCTNTTGVLANYVRREGIELPAIFDQTNLQFAVDENTRRLLLIDFGAYRYQRRFRHHLMVAYERDTDAYVRVQKASTTGFVKVADEPLAAARSYRVVDRQLPVDWVTGDRHVRTKELGARTLELMCAIEALGPLCAAINRLVRGELDLIGSKRPIRRP